MAGVPWGDKKKDALKKLWGLYVEGELSKTDLEKTLDRTWNAIQIMASKLNLTNEVDDFINREYLKEIGVEIDI